MIGDSICSGACGLCVAPLEVAKEEPEGALAHAVLAVVLDLRVRLECLCNGGHGQVGRRSSHLVRLLVVKQGAQPHVHIRK